MKTLANTETKTTSKIFFERPGYKTPVLRRRKNEGESEFVERMNQGGFSNLEKVGFHMVPESSDVHVGSLDGCPYCSRAAKRNVKNVGPQTIKPDAKLESASTAPEKPADKVVNAADNKEDPVPKQPTSEVKDKKDNAIGEDFSSFDTSQVKVEEEEKSSIDNLTEETEPVPSKKGRGRPRKVK